MNEGQNSRSSVNNDSNPALNELLSFRQQLKGNGDYVHLILPGFLFRNGVQRRKAFTPHEYAQYRAIDLDRYHDDPEYRSTQPYLSTRDSEWVPFIQKAELIERHKETYQRGREAQKELLQKIKPLEILKMVHDLWEGKGVIITTSTEGGQNLIGQMQEYETGGRLIAYGHKIERELAVNTPSGYMVRNSSPDMGGWHQPPSSVYETGEWVTYATEITQSVNVDFGVGAGGRFGFADRYLPGSGEVALGTLPEEIWYSPENLGVKVSIPFHLRRVSPPSSQLEIKAWYSKFDNDDNLLGRVENERVFPKDVSQDEIMEYLYKETQKQRRLGYLPGQQWELEVAKIGELARRGIKLDIEPRVPIIFPD